MYKIFSRLEIDSNGVTQELFNKFSKKEQIEYLRTHPYSRYGRPSPHKVIEKHRKQRIENFEKSYPLGFIHHLNKFKNSLTPQDKRIKQTINRLLKKYKQKYPDLKNLRGLEEKFLEKYNKNSIKEEIKNLKEVLRNNSDFNGNYLPGSNLTNNEFKILKEQLESLENLKKENNV